MDTPQTQKTPDTGKKKNKATLASVVGILVFVVVFIVAHYVGQKSTTAVLDKVDGTSQQDIIKQAVAQLKNETPLPKNLDASTTLTDIQEAPSAFRYTYTLHDIDVSKLSNESLKSSIAPTLCGTADTRNNLDKGINMEYSYQVKDSAQTFLFTVSKADCK